MKSNTIPVLHFLRVRCLGILFDIFPDVIISYLVSSKALEGAQGEDPHSSPRGILSRLLTCNQAGLFIFLLILLFISWDIGCCSFELRARIDEWRHRLLSFNLESNLISWLTAFNLLSILSGWFKNKNQASENNHGGLQGESFRRTPPILPILLLLLKIQFSFQIFNFQKIHFLNFQILFFIFIFNIFTRLPQRWGQAWYNGPKIYCFPPLCTRPLWPALTHPLEEVTVVTGVPWSTPHRTDRVPLMWHYMLT